MSRLAFLFVITALLGASGGLAGMTAETIGPLSAPGLSVFGRTSDLPEPGPIEVSRGQHVRIVLQADGVAFRLDEGARHHEIRVRLMGGQAESLKTVHELSSIGRHLIRAQPGDWAPPLGQPHWFRLESVYPGIDLDVGLRADRLGFDVLVSAGADPTQVQIAIDGADWISIEPDGDLALGTPLGALILLKPVIFQDVPGDGRKAIDGGFRLLGAHLVGLALDPYDRSRDLVIRLPAADGGFAPAQ